MHPVRAHRASFTCSLMLSMKWRDWAAISVVVCESAEKESMSVAKGVGVQGKAISFKRGCTSRSASPPRPKYTLQLTPCGFVFLCSRNMSNLQPTTGPSALDAFVPSPPRASHTTLRHIALPRLPPTALPRSAAPWSCVLLGPPLAAVEVAVYDWDAEARFCSARIERP